MAKIAQCCCILHDAYSQTSKRFSRTQGLEYPEIREFVKTYDNVTWVKPEKSFKDVVTGVRLPGCIKARSNDDLGVAKRIESRVDYERVRRPIRFQFV